MSNCQPHQTGLGDVIAPEKTALMLHCDFGNRVSILIAAMNLALAATCACRHSARPNKLDIAHVVHLVPLLVLFAHRASSTQWCMPHSAAVSSAATPSRWVVPATAHVPLPPALQAGCLVGNTI
jgi:hypothetical protein